MTISSALTALNTDIQNARTAITNKGGTVTSGGGSSQLAADIATIPSGGGSGKYQLLQRISNDNGNEIGTVSGFFTDANDVEYAVVCLDAQYRLAQGTYCSNTNNSITNLPMYQDQTLFSSSETSTFNTQKILDFCASNSATSTSCTHCRSKSFTIGGTTYYGQLPNIAELIDIFRRRVEVNLADTSSSSYSSLVIPTASRTWSSTQYAGGYSWVVNKYGVQYNTKSQNSLVIPVLEIPNAV